MFGCQFVEWVMNNCVSLNFKYIIWGQCIWSFSDGVKVWISWCVMEDCGDVI